MAEKEGNGSVEGQVVRVIGPVVDVDFPPGQLPEINTALEVQRTLDRLADIPVDIEPLFTTPM